MEKQLSNYRGELISYVDSLKVDVGPYGSYNFGADEGPDLYASCDAAILRTVMGEEFGLSLSNEQRRQWIDHINSFAEGDGTYRTGRESNRHSEEHRNGMVIGALGVLGGRQPRPVGFYEEFESTDSVTAWLERIDWRRQWSASHLFWGGMHCFSMSRHCSDPWRDTVFRWLDDNVDPETGWWRKGVPHSDAHQPLGGGAHIWPFYQHHDRLFPYPRQVIDSILRMQKPDGSWIGFGNYLDLDALYGLAYMQSLAPDHRSDDVQRAVELHGDLVAVSFDGFAEGRPDMHTVLAVAGEIGLLQQLSPQRFSDTVAWTDIFSDPRFYRTGEVECE